MLTATCHCKAIRIVFPPPTEPLNECLCSICRRYGALWAYYPVKDVQIIRDQADVTDPDGIYLWGDKMCEFHRCAKCGCVTHWEATDKSYPKMGVNARMLERVDLEALETLKSDGP
ncbi:hypothetical protein SERLA73DRAFT_186072 [Serpula lacrymans var. lacrymans S7.3]|uniref:CENP-V/GFA domain-containing protein n=1 Tax=Serpula lacrymans var. lacrymans (strain S7.3) TaxID=936435 RepID=F8Q6W8_SERL3|nr:hypothetical protein SERLA73DRAFT_186072 [Serpula lacrymans var. lacrymans S7.3]